MMRKTSNASILLALLFAIGVAFVWYDRRPPQTLLQPVSADTQVNAGDGWSSVWMVKRSETCLGTFRRKLEGDNGEIVTLAGSEILLLPRDGTVPTRFTQVIPVETPAQAYVYRLAIFFECEGRPTSRVLPIVWIPPSVPIIVKGDDK